MKKHKKIGVIVVAGGRGERAGSHASGLAKQYWPLAGKSVIGHAIEAFLRLDEIDFVQPVIAENDFEAFAALDLPADTRLGAPVAGGADRQGSVLAGLEALYHQGMDWVLVHDAARPLVARAVIEGVLEGLEHAPAVLPATGVVDTIKRSLDGTHILRTEDRRELFAAQTPQGFDFELILAAHRKARTVPEPFTDDTAIAEWAGLKVQLCQGSPQNIKITLPGDLELAEHYLGGEVTRFETRVGSGIDIHPFVAGDHVVLGGIAIPHDKRLKGHSDADAALHVLTDALLGALADGDIGKHFPPSDPQWRGAPSRVFLEFAVERLQQRGGRIVHLDLTIVAEAPKIGPHVSAMRESVAMICGIDVGRVSVKATTSEKMGFVGRGEGLMTQATATVELPRKD